MVAANRIPARDSHAVADRGVTSAVGDNQRGVVLQTIAGECRRVNRDGVVGTDRNVFCDRGSVRIEGEVSARGEGEDFGLILPSCHSRSRVVAHDVVTVDRGHAFARVGVICEGARAVVGVARNLKSGKVERVLLLRGFVEGDIAAVGLRRAEEVGANLDYAVVEGDVLGCNGCVGGERNVGVEHNAVGGSLVSQHGMVVVEGEAVGRCARRNEGVLEGGLTGARRPRRSAVDRVFVQGVAECQRDRQFVQGADRNRLAAHEAVHIERAILNRERVAGD